MDSEAKFNLLNEVVDSSSSDDDDDELYIAAAHIVATDIGNEPRHRGSVEGHRVLNRDRQSGHVRLYQDYFSDDPTYEPNYFRRRFVRTPYFFSIIPCICVRFLPNKFVFLHRFRMRRHVFVRIMNAVEDHDDYFVQKRNAAGTLGLSCLQKVVAAFRMIAYGVAADATDDYVRIGESTALDSLRRFVRAVVHIFGHEYMRKPNEHDTARLLEIGERRGFPGMLGSIDCMHWT